MKIVGKSRGVIFKFSNTKQMKKIFVHNNNNNGRIRNDLDSVECQDSSLFRKLLRKYLRRYQMEGNFYSAREMFARPRIGEAFQTISHNGSARVTREATYSLRIRVGHSRLGRVCTSGAI